MEKLANEFTQVPAAEIEDSSCGELELESNLRYERKYRVNYVSTSHLFAIIKSHPFLFREIYSARTVNNIYFDTPDNLRYYFENRDGLMTRQKVRIRWYGDLFTYVGNPILEVKFRENNLGDKWMFPLTSFDFSKPLLSETLSNIIKNSALRPEIKNLVASLRPTLLNSYHRKYFLSADKKFRLTVDYGMKYRSMRSLTPSPLNLIERKDTAIVELKYAPHDDDRAKEFSAHFPFRVAKSSKYCDGIELA